MKKSLFFAFAVAGMLCSCSSEESIDGGAANVGDVENSELVPIKIGMSSNVITRGSGTVGGTTDETNVWNGQLIKVFMLKKGTIEAAETGLSYYTDKDGGKKLFWDEELYAPTGSNSDLAFTVKGDIKYYPSDKTLSDFWAYHVDELDATDKAMLTEPEPNDDNTEISAGITIDGSQDVMVAKAEYDGSNPNVPVEKAYSAFAARYGVQPKLVFNHLLTRLQFTAVPGNSLSTAEEKQAIVEKNINVRSIKVRSKRTGKLIVAYTGENVEQLQLEPINENTEMMELKYKSDDAEGTDLVALDTKDWFVDNVDGVRIGEALLVAPQNEYSMEIELSQSVQTTESGEVSIETFTTPATIKLDSASGIAFEAGHSYNVQISVWGLEKIEITATLTKWEDGGDIPVDPENSDN